MTTNPSPTREDLITIDPGIMGGAPVFKGTRVLLDTLFDHLETGSTIDEFLDDFPGVSREQAIAVIEYLKTRVVA